MGWELFEIVTGYAGREVDIVETEERSNPRSCFGSKHVNIFVGILGTKSRRELVKLA